MPSKNPSRRFQGAHFGLLSLHGKETILAPMLYQRWRASLTHSEAYDTDSLGTFSGDVERSLSPTECALKKARLALELTGADFGLGSEGSFNTGPWGFGVINQELVACVPASGNWYVVGWHTALAAVEECRYDEPERQAHFWQHLPEGQGVMLIANGLIAKGIRTQSEAKSQLYQWYGEHIPSDLRIAYDLRAHQSPVRRTNIALAVFNLLDRLDSPCGECGQPGFWPDREEAGLPCADCGCPTQSPRARIAHCESCGNQQIIPVEAEYADPASCQWCNP